MYSKASAMGERARIVSGGKNGARMERFYAYAGGRADMYAEGPMFGWVDMRGSFLADGICIADATFLSRPELGAEAIALAGEWAIHTGRYGIVLYACGDGGTASALESRGFYELPLGGADGKIGKMFAGRTVLGFDTIPSPRTAVMSSW